MLTFSVLCFFLPLWIKGQDAPLCVYRMENLPEMAALACFSPSHVGTRFRNDFGTKEMMCAEVYGVLGRNHNVLTAGLYHYGYAGYGNMRLSFGYGRNFGDRFAFTVRFFYLMDHARGYPARHSLCVDLSLAVPLTPKFCLTASVYNPFVMRYGIVNKDVIPLKFIVGGVFVPAKKLLFSISTSKTLPGAWEVCGQFITHPTVPLLLAADFANTHLGLSVYVKHKNFLFSVKAAWYYRISVSPEIGGYYCLDDAMIR